MRGAGTGTLCGILLRQTGLSVTALEPVPAMLAKLRGTAELQGATTLEGFCDSIEDRVLFPAGRFDAIVSRQLVDAVQRMESVNALPTTRTPRYVVVAGK